MRKGTMALATAAALAGGMGAGGTCSQEDLQYNLFRNPGFEEGDAHWSFGRGWGPLPEAEKADHIEIRTDGPKAGRRYLRVKNEGKTFISVAPADRIRFQAGRTYQVSWWSRGWAPRAGHEQGSNRLHISGAGVPEYTGDFPYTSEDWTYHEYGFTATRAGEGRVSFWVWGGGHCDVDNLMVRPSFWSTDKDRNAASPGEVVKIAFDMAGRDATPAAVAYRITAPDGRELLGGKIEGRTPLRKELEFSARSPGCYRLTSEAKTPGGVFRDTLTICIKAPKGGLDGVKAFWEDQGK